MRGIEAGARWGASAIPAHWRRIVHGWPGLHSRDLVALAFLTANGGPAEPEAWPTLPRMDYAVTTQQMVSHPDDDQVLLEGPAATITSLDT